MIAEMTTLGDLRSDAKFPNNLQIKWVPWYENRCPLAAKYQFSVEKEEKEGDQRFGSEQRQNNTNAPCSYPPNSSDGEHAAKETVIWGLFCR